MSRFRAIRDGLALFALSASLCSGCLFPAIQLDPLPPPPKSEWPQGSCSNPDGVVVVSFPDPYALATIDAVRFYIGPDPAGPWTFCAEIPCRVERYLFEDAAEEVESWACPAFENQIFAGTFGNYPPLRGCIWSIGEPYSIAGSVRAGLLESEKVIGATDNGQAVFCWPLHFVCGPAGCTLP